ncbi:hypothetical protein Tmar_0900 [Thermaerobacter marianensis DSM 12885]|uniref:Metallo-beta-lactamase domain-containing protein n=1 Tax=Thermaerobacter marianensis (strain ATCC 700841 / DSM 12885 / JCM 10246 / 7p75a) TaxID=644966 RepID=E6SJ86_THEM7|nr:MBL fold metallo-hydrolase [Thermaerobacter marianensis]ADU51014.1 hypothetical protein Tmar_0900 [Thermaerobacter marianensis DSM 12885]
MTEHRRQGAAAGAAAGAGAGGEWVAPGILRLSLPTPYPVGDVNVYAVLGRVPTLVDVGPGSPAAREALMRGLAAHGLELRSFAQVVITHTHLDHFGFLRHWFAAPAVTAAALAPAASPAPEPFRGAEPVRSPDGRPRQPGSAPGAADGILAREAAGHAGAGCAGDLAAGDDATGDGGRRLAASRPRLLAHRWGARHFRGGDDPDRVRFFRDFVAAAGVPAAEAGGVLQEMGLYQAAEPAVPADAWLEDGDAIEMGDDRWLVLHTPGHAQSQICLYRERDGLLISSDHLLPAISSNALLEPPPLDEHGRPVRPEPPRSLVDYRVSLQRVRALPVSLCLPGHGEPFRDPHRLIDRRLAAMEDRADRIRAALAELGGEATLYRLATYLFGNGDPAHLLLALSEVNGHLEWMESEGRVRRRLEPAAGDGGVAALFAPA